MARLGQKYKYSVRSRKSSSNPFSFFTGIISFVQNVIRNYSEYSLIIKVVCVALVAGFVIMLGFDYYQVRQLADFQPNVTTQIYDKNGKLISELFSQKREVVSFDKIPKNLIHAFIAMEDNEFYDHWGINPKGIMRAFLVNVASGRVRQGGSTITQQLSKIIMTSQERTIFRKAKEAFISLMIEATYSKDRILELYLNQLFMGHGAFGVETASKLYFGKNVWELNLAECALLASITSAPNGLSPIKYPDRAMKMHRQALAHMVDMGFIKKADAEKAYIEFWPPYLSYINELPPTLTAFSERIDHAPWFTEYIRRKIVDQYGEDAVYNKGLVVMTTLDLKKQLAADRVMQESLKRQTNKSGALVFTGNDKVVEQILPTVEMFTLLFGMDAVSSRGTVLQSHINKYYQEEVLDQLDSINFLIGSDDVGGFADDYRSLFLQERELQRVEGALITVNHNTGYIEAMVGGSAFTSENQLNRSIQSRRQTGSSIKPLLYAAAFDTRKFTPATGVLDSPVVYINRDEGDWIPENYDGEYYGLVRLREALAKSINVVSIRIAEKLGIETVIKYYQKLLHFNDAEAKTRIPRNLSIALGSIDVSPLELARAYGVIARGGTDFIPFAIRQVKDSRGKVLDDYEADIREQMDKMTKNGTNRILKPETAQVMISVLSTVMSAGTGLSASIGRPAGGKTGTTNSWKDAWFVGFTPDITTCVWVGYDRLGMSLGVGESGGVVAAPIWGRYMREALQGDPVTSFPSYAGLESAEVCARSGLALSEFCKDKITEVFVPGTVPTEICTTCENGIELPAGLTRKGPSENISKRQTEEVMKNIKRKNQDAVDTVGGDLLE